MNERQTCCDRETLDSWTEPHAGPGLTVDDVLGRDGLLVGLVAYFVGFRGDEVDELRAAVHYQLPGVVRHSYVGESLFDHLVDGRSGDGEVVVIPRGRSHRGRRRYGRRKSSGSWLGGEKRWRTTSEPNVRRVIQMSSRNETFSQNKAGWAARYVS